MSSQNKLLMNGAEIWQPDEGGLGYSFSTTYTEDTGRVQSGVLHLSGMFTVEQLSYEASGVPVAEAARILQIIAKGAAFSLYYFSAYYGMWRTAPFYVGQGDSNLKTLKISEERVERLSFNMTGVNPI